MNREHPLLAVSGYLTLHMLPLPPCGSFLFRLTAWSVHGRSAICYTKGNCYKYSLVGKDKIMLIPDYYLRQNTTYWGIGEMREAVFWGRW